MAKTGFWLRGAKGKFAQGANPALTSEATTATAAAKPRATAATRPATATRRPRTVISIGLTRTCVFRRSARLAGRALHSRSFGV